MAWWHRFFPGPGHDVRELARRLGLEPESLTAVQPTYREFTVAKRRGGVRTICEPAPELKALQRRILRRVLARLKVHPAVHGFERGRSIATNAKPHEKKAVVVTLDIENFFASTKAKRVAKFFRRIGWNRPAAELLTRLCTWNGGLPQGAPTSPKLSNLVNYLMDARLAGLARSVGADYTRYADDITFSFVEEPSLPIERFVQGIPPTSIDLTRNVDRVGPILWALCFDIVEEFGEGGYRVNRKKGIWVYRRHHRQKVTGLVVNDGVRLPRKTRRWLRSVEHRMRQKHSGQFNDSWKEPTITESQLQGWWALRKMVEGGTSSQPPGKALFRQLSIQPNPPDEHLPG